MLCWVSQNHLDNRALLCTFKTFPQCPYRTHLFVGRIRHFELICVTHSSFCSYLSMFFSMFFLWFSHVYPIKLMIHIRFSHWCSRFSEDFPMKIPQHRQFHQVAKAATAPSQGQNAALASTYLGTCHAATRGHGTNYSYNRGMMIYSS